MQDRCQLRQEVLEEGGWSTSKHNGVWVQSEQSYTVSCYFWDLTSSGLASLNQVTIANPLFRMTFHVVLSESGKFKDITTKNVTTQTNAISGPHRHHWICKLIALLSAVFSKVPTFFFLLFFHAQWLHTTGCGALIDPSEHSKIELETGYGSSFYTLSGDPRENKGLRCIQNKEMGRNSPSLREGREVGSPSPTPRVGHSPWPLTSLWKKGI